MHVMYSFLVFYSCNTQMDAWTAIPVHLKNEICNSQRTTKKCEELAYEMSE